MTLGTMAWSVSLFLLAGLMEIGGGYVVWLWLREGRAAVLGALGGLLCLLGVTVIMYWPRVATGQG